MSDGNVEKTGKNTQVIVTYFICAIVTLSYVSDGNVVKTRKITQVTVTY